MSWLPWGRGADSKELTMHFRAGCVANRAGWVALLQQRYFLPVPWTCLSPVAFPNPNGYLASLERDKEVGRGARDLLQVSDVSPAPWCDLVIWTMLGAREAGECRSLVRRPMPAELSPQGELRGARIWAI